MCNVANERGRKREKVAPTAKPVDHSTVESHTTTNAEFSLTLLSMTHCGGHCYKSKEFTLVAHRLCATALCQAK